MIVNKALNKMVEEAGKLHYTPAQMKERESMSQYIATRLTIGGNGLENLMEELPIDSFTKLNELAEVTPQTKSKIIISLKSAIKNFKNPDVEKEPISPAKSLFELKKIRTELKRAVRHDESAQKSLKQVQDFLVKDEPIKAFVDKVTTLVKNEIGANSYEEMIYNLGVTSKEWKYSMSQKPIFFDKSPMEQIQGFLSYFIKK